MSNRKAGESPARRKPKVSLAMVISQGLGGPNPYTERSWGMGSRLIFRPSSCISPERRSVVTWAYYWIYVSSLRGSPNGEGEGLSTDKPTWVSTLPRKALWELIQLEPYRKPPQVGWCKCTKANG